MEKSENLENAVHTGELKRKNRIVYFDILNILACISVVFIHCNDEIVHNYTTVGAWKTSLIVEVICYWAVPVFLMLSGATLMKYRERYDTKTFFKKRIIKVVIPFVFWAIVMLLWKYKIGDLEISNWSIAEILNIIFNNKEESTYYFLFIILGVYLTMPVLSLLAKDENRKTLWYLVIVMFITISVLPVILSFYGVTYNSYLSILLDEYIIFVILGYLLSTMEMDKRVKYIMYILAIVSCVIRYTVTYCLSIIDDATNKILFGYTQFHSVFLAVAVFEFIKSINWDKIISKDKLKNVIAKISGCSFGIYLIHKIIIYYEIDLLNIDKFSICWRTIGAIATYLMCLIIVYLMKKIPIVKKVVP